ncbi:hypothetical protein F0562_013419 [Nyssa sinensis]|uniref:Uncharacterized protein n=1 Tax=Nyssa sinensis TaxID=561372 RepID=A0A5J4ZK61_9ASTE|nr:hypothetical protein F0562_013419 [Nyssa sinensis]
MDDLKIAGTSSTDDLSVEDHHRQLGHSRSLPWSVSHSRLTAKQLQSLASNAVTTTNTWNLVAIIREETSVRVGRLIVQWSWVDSTEEGERCSDNKDGVGRSVQFQVVDSNVARKLCVIVTVCGSELAEAAMQQVICVSIGEHQADWEVPTSAIVARSRSELGSTSAIGTAVAAVIGAAIAALGGGFKLGGIEC